MGLGGLMNAGGSSVNAGYADVFVRFCSHCSDIEKETKKKEMSSLLWESANKNDLNGVKQAMGETGDPNICDLQGVSALLLAVKNKNPAVCPVFFAILFSCIHSFFVLAYSVDDQFTAIGQSKSKQCESSMCC
jgi:hypothetical protein